MLQWETVKSFIEIRSFLGLVGYYVKFIEDFSNSVMHLTQLTQKGQAHVWDALCEESFIELKKKLASSPILILLNLSESFIVYCDASMMAIGGVLM